MAEEALQNGGGGAKPRAGAPSNSKTYTHSELTYIREPILIWATTKVFWKYALLAVVSSIMLAINYSWLLYYSGSSLHWHPSYLLSSDHLIGLLCCNQWKSYVVLYIGRIFACHLPYRQWCNFHSQQNPSLNALQLEHFEYRILFTFIQWTCCSSIFHSETLFLPTTHRLIIHIFTTEHKITLLAALANK